MHSNLTEQILCMIKGGNCSRWLYWKGRFAEPTSNMWLRSQKYTFDFELFESHTWLAHKNAFLSPDFFITFSMPLCDGFYFLKKSTFKFMLYGFYHLLTDCSWSYELYVCFEKCYIKDTSNYLYCSQEIATHINVLTFLNVRQCMRK